MSNILPSPDQFAPPTPDQMAPNQLPDPLQHEQRGGGLIDAARTAVYGIGAGVSKRRMERAGSRMERMDHKMALYGMLGDVALQEIPIAVGADGEPIDTDKIKLKDLRNTPIVRRPSGITHNGRVPKPRTFSERFMDKLIARTDRRKFDREVYRHRELANSGATATGRTDTFSKKSRAMTTYRRHLVNREYRRGGLTSEQRHLQKILARSQPNERQTRETRMQKHTRKELETATDAEKRMAEQKLMNRWRKTRQLMAIEDIKKHYHRSQARTEKQAAARERRQNARQS